MENITNFASSSLVSKLPQEVWGASAILGMIGVSTLIAILVAWTLAWKGLAMWKAARNGSKWWFIILLVVNTVGILDIIYYFFVDKKKK